MAAHALLLCSVALLAALCRPGLCFTDEDSQPGLTFDEVPEILDISQGWGLSKLPSRAPPWPPQQGCHLGGGHLGLGGALRLTQVLALQV
ncbi:unnamed protein product [Boreogadus saida]